MEHATTADVFVTMSSSPLGKCTSPNVVKLPQHQESDISERTCETVDSAFENNCMEIEWHELANVRYLARGGSSLVYSARYLGKPVVVKTLRPKIRQSSLAISDIETELAILSQLNHRNIVKLVGAGLMSKTGVRFLVFEKLDITLSNRLGFDDVQRNKLDRFRKKKSMSQHETLQFAKSLAVAMNYLHSNAIPNGMVLHRDLKPDNIAFSQDGTVKLLDFGLARILENANPESKEVYSLSGETGSLRYMAPEVAKGESYNHKADVYSFAIILWEMLAGKKSFTGMKSEEEYFGFVVHRGFRPPLREQWPPELCALLSDCWHAELENRPDFEQIIARLDELLSSMAGSEKSNGFLQRFKGFMDRSPKDGEGSSFASA